MQLILLMMVEFGNCMYKSITLEILLDSLSEIPFFNWENSWILSLFKKQEPAQQKPSKEKSTQVEMSDFVKAFELDNLSSVIYGKSFKRKSLKKLRRFNPNAVKVKRIQYDKGVYIPAHKIAVGINRIYYVNPQLSIHIRFINAKEKIAYGRKVS